MLYKAVVVMLGWSLGATPVAQDLLVRLRTPLTTAEKAGMRFEAVVTGCVRADCAALLPQGSTIHGFVRQVRAVGVGVKREKASMALEFDGCTMPDGEPVECRAQLLELENARETVTQGNQIHGILAANHPHSFLSGLWIRPTSALVPRSIMGITGAGRMLYTGVSPHPMAAGAIIVTRLLVLRLPEPEIHIPAGAEMVLRVVVEPLEGAALAPPGAALSENLATWLGASPANIVLHDGTAAADIINIAFRGTREEVSAAFAGAGWSTADTVNMRTFRQTYRAVTQMSSYPTAPVSPLRYEGRLPDLVFQKSFNTLSKRHHIRLWQMDSPDGPVWLGAATHDVSMAIDWKRMLLTHRIDREIDRERDKVLADLSFAGCVTSAVRMERATLAANNARIVTDGALHVLDAQTCEQPAAAVALGKQRKTPVMKALARRTILESRHYLLRGNGYYWAFRGLRSRTMLGRFAAPKPTVAELPPESMDTSWRRGSGSNRRVRVLQTLALPLGYRAPREGRLN